MKKERWKQCHKNNERKITINECGIIKGIGRRQTKENVERRTLRVLGCTRQKERKQMNNSIKQN
jgi:hypothetical protein